MSGPGANAVPPLLPRAVAADLDPRFVLDERACQLLGRVLSELLAAEHAPAPCEEPSETQPIDESGR